MSNGITLKQTEAVISLVGGYLAQGEVVEEGRSTVRLPEGEGRGVAGNFEVSPTILGCNLGLEGPPVLWVRVQSLERKGTLIIGQTSSI